MFIDTSRQQKEAPLGAECAHISLLTELGNQLQNSFYKHSVPTNFLFRLFVQTEETQIRQKSGQPNSSSLDQVRHAFGPVIIS